MKIRPLASLSILVAASVCTSAFGQLVEMVQGVNESVRASFTYTWSLTGDWFTIIVDNSITQGTNGWQGTIVSFGINTPFTNSQMLFGGVGVPFTETWLKTNAGHHPAKMVEDLPYSITSGGTTYTEDLGVSAGTLAHPNLNNGIEFGEKVQFTFNFAHENITSSNLNGFFNNPHDLVVSWKDVDKGCDGPFSTIGFADLPPAPEPSTYGAMGAVALLGVVALRRRSEKKSAFLKQV